ncbi:MAG: HesA/MoeB/ThiF family protein [Candidatus Bathyarchaeia archaeon]|nr:HesA/MoeB/ThiF family protein [Candidatus Bathyarchaeota archaeon A05DMB-4]MDH7595898.1 HesA/MoeB/ThiF family protein [Candidatus Bathyarchaeota archaeon]
MSFDANAFYSRQIVLSELGREGQRKLGRSKVAIIGLGGLGTASALYLALAGVRHLRLVDQDTVEWNNLHRQILYSPDDLRRPKAEAAAYKIRRANPGVKIESIAENARRSNIDQIVKGMDCVVDGLDNMKTRYLLNRACARHKIPYVYGAAIGLEGVLSVFHPPETPCLECIFPRVDDRFLQTCETRGVLGATAGIIGTMQAMETIKLLTGIGEVLKGKLMVCDFSDMNFVTINVYKRPNCTACTGAAVEFRKEKERLTWLCGQNTVNVNPPRLVETSMDKLHRKLQRHFKILVKSPVVIVFQYDGNVEVSFFQYGRMLIKNVEDEEKALKVYRDVWKKLGLQP